MTEMTNNKVELLCLGCSKMIYLEKAKLDGHTNFLHYYCVDCQTARWKERLFNDNMG